MSYSHSFAVASVLAALTFGPQQARAQWQAVAKAPSAQQGNFTLQLSSIRRAAGLRFGEEQVPQAEDDGDTIRLLFWLKAKEKVRFLHTLSVLQVTAARSDDGTPLSPSVSPSLFGPLGTSVGGSLSRPRYSLESALTREDSGATFSVPFALAKGSTRSLALLKGEAHLMTFKGTEKWSVANPFEKPGEAREQAKTIAVAGVPIHYRFASAQEDPTFVPAPTRPGAAPSTIYRARIFVEPQEKTLPESAQEPESKFARLSRVAPTARLLDAQSREFRLNSSSLPRLYTDATLEMTFSPTPEQARDGATPTRFEMEVATALEETILPFEFQNIPLPVAEKLARP